MAHCCRGDTLKELCEVLKPPPLPPSDFNGFEELRSILAESESYLCYTKICNETLFEVTTPMTTIHSTNRSTTISSTVETSSPTSIVTTIVSTTKPAPQDTGYWVPIVVVVLIVLIAIAVILFIWRKKGKNSRSVSMNSLPLKKYEDTNYLASKAQAGQCWNPSTDGQLSSGNTGNQYGSFPPLNGDIKQQVTVNHETGGEPNKRDSAYDKSEVVGYVNENFNREEGNGARSPGVDSQTPLFDMVDGVLPNAIPPKGTEIQESKSNTKAVELDSENNVSQSSEPTHSGQSDKSVFIRLHKRNKKPLRLSAPVKIMEDEANDSAANRKSL